MHRRILLSLFLLFLSDLISAAVVKVEADPGKGFSWPYYLNIPDVVTGDTLLVEPNNTGHPDDDPAVHDTAAGQLVGWRANYVTALGSPLLIPAFPRPMTDWLVYTHALDRDCLTTTIAGLERLDLQLIAMIGDAQGRLAGDGVALVQKVFIMGFSASGMFANRFTALHPDRVKAAAVGSPGGWPLAPLGEWQGETLRYNVGVADLEELVGVPFDTGRFSKVPLYFYIGDQDTNDSVIYEDGYETQDKDLVFALFGATPVERWPKAQELYEAAACNAQFVLYPGIGHSITGEMESDVIEFFLSVENEPETADEDIAVTDDIMTTDEDVAVTDDIMATDEDSLLGDDAVEQDDTDALLSDEAAEQEQNESNMSDVTDNDQADPTDDEINPPDDAADAAIPDEAVTFDADSVPAGDGCGCTLVF